MTKQKTNLRKPTGWVFWGITTAILLPLCMWGAFHWSDPESPLVPKLALGGIGAVISASVLSMIANFFIDRANAKHRRAARKEAKKRKR